MKPLCLLRLIYCQILLVFGLFWLMPPSFATMNICNWYDAFSRIVSDAIMGMGMGMGKILMKGCYNLGRTIHCQLKLWELICSRMPLTLSWRCMINNTPIATLSSSITHHVLFLITICIQFLACIALHRWFSHVFKLQIPWGKQHFECGHQRFLTSYKTATSVIIMERLEPIQRIGDG